MAAAKARGTPLPKAFREAPILEDAYHKRVFEAFWQLSTCRQIGMGAIGPIPWDSIDRYATKNGFASTEVEYDSFVYMIQTLDGLFMEHQAKKIKEQSSKGGAGGRAGSIRGAHARPRKGGSRRGR